jgi:hypothetical protein
MSIVMKNIALISCVALMLFSGVANGQSIPSGEENIPYLVTFGKKASKSWGDDDFTQVFFFVIPESENQPIFIRVYDPDTGGEIDEIKSSFNTTTKFSVYGGAGTISEEDARKIQPTGNYKSGNLLASKSFAVSEKYDEKWYTFGPFNPKEGELSPQYGGYVFKVIAQGTEGDDGNLYRYFMSTKADQNQAVEGGNAFTYEYSFRLHNDANQISHIYPFIDSKVISVKQYNFDWDNDGYVRIISVAKKGENLTTSADNEWVESEHKIVTSEHNSSLDIQFIKNPSKPVLNNNVVFYVRNQYGEFLPFYASPIGGVPKYLYTIGIKPK